MKQSSTKNAHQFLQANNQDLTTLLAKVKALAALEQHVMRYIDPAMHAYCQVANYNAGRLIMLAANGSIATQLRFQTHDLLQQFKQEAALRYIKEIHCIVRPFAAVVSLQQTNKQLRSMQPLSPETAAMLQNIAQSIEDDNLREVMEKIAKHV
jgi:hypothetical protein